MNRNPAASRMRLTSYLIGIENEPILIIDNMLSNPEELLRIADDAAFAPAFSTAGGYPGLRAGAPQAYVDGMVCTLIGPIRETFGLGSAAIEKTECDFSLITRTPHELTPPQRAPHVDATSKDQLAVLHYLCPSDFGGTAYYRHRATGFETITDDRKAVFLASRAGEGVSDGYVSDGEPWFEQTAAIDALFNRVIIYRSNVLHSGVIPRPNRLSADPRHGRLTVNMFIKFAPAVG